MKKHLLFSVKFYLLVCIVGYNCKNSNSKIHDAPTLTYQANGFDIASSKKYSKYNFVLYNESILKYIISDPTHNTYIDSFFKYKPVVIFREEMDILKLLDKQSDNIIVYNTKLLNLYNIVIYVNNNDVASPDSMILNIPDSLSSGKPYIAISNRNNKLFIPLHTFAYRLIESVCILENSKDDKIMTISIVAPMALGSALPVKLIIILNLLNNEIVFYDTI